MRPLFRRRRLGTKPARVKAPPNRSGSQFKYGLEHVFFRRMGKPGNLMGFSPKESSPSIEAGKSIL